MRHIVRRSYGIQVSSDGDYYCYGNNHNLMCTRVAPENYDCTARRV